MQVQKLCHCIVCCQGVIRNEQEQQQENRHIADTYIYLIILAFMVDTFNIHACG